MCEPALTAGRIPSCIDSEGLDVYVVEADGALSVTWNVNGALDYSGGFRVRWGTDSGQYDGAVEVPPDVREAVIVPLPNDTIVYVAVEALDAGGDATFLSCEVFATPLVLVFAPDLLVNADTAGDQHRPDLVSNLEGTRLFLAWEDEGTIVLAISTDFGDTWTEVVPAPGAGQAEPSLAVREEVVDAEGNVVTPETLFLAWSEGGTVVVQRYLSGAGVFETPLALGTGVAPDVATGPGALHVAYEDGGAIYHVGSNDDGLSFLAPLLVSGATTLAHAPAAAVNGFTGDVYVAWDAISGAGDSDVYFAASLDNGVTFGGVVRVDDDPMGQNQLNVSLAVDERSQKIYATWEDRRGGANVYFTWSEDGGATWLPNIDVGAGLGGDQFHPAAVVDFARNVYVVFQDTTNGARVVFSRFAADGVFDPPLAPSSAAGMAGVVADYPTVATDRYGSVYVAWEENRSGPQTDVFFARAD